MSKAVYNMRYPLTTKINIPDYGIAPEIVPSINPNTGTWFIGAIDTEVKAQGPQGNPGVNGKDGRSGETGAKGATGAQGIQGEKGNPGTNGTNGITPHIDPTTKHWMIGTVDTQILAEGVRGAAGSNGANGRDGTPGAKGNSGIDGVTPHIDGTSKHWMIGTTDTNVRAEGIQGIQGVQGLPGASGATGEKGATGAPGTNGTNGTNGKSAYEYAQAGGYAGTEAEFTAAIVKAAGAVTMTEVKALGYMKAEKVATLPAVPDPNTVYFVTG